MLRCILTYETQNLTCSTLVASQAQYLKRGVTNLWMCLPQSRLRPSHSVRAVSFSFTTMLGPPSMMMLDRHGCWPCALRLAIVAQRQAVIVSNTNPQAASGGAASKQLPSSCQHLSNTRYSFSSRVSSMMVPSVARACEGFRKIRMAGKRTCHSIAVVSGHSTG